jgi:Ca-activated chloride channel family protein
MRPLRPSLASTLLAALAVSAALAVLVPAGARAQGVLVPTDRGVAPLALRHHRVNVTVENGTAVTTVESVFHNASSRPLEATFLLPMPEQAAILEFAMWMNGQRVKGEVLDRGRARSVYEGIVRRMRDPGLIEWAGHSLFQARIFPVPARGDQKIEISWTQVLPYEDGVYRYVYPLKTPGQCLTTLEDFTITAKLQSKTPIRNVYSPSHRVYVRKADDHHATVGFEKDAAVVLGGPGSDFELLYSVSQKDVGLNLLTWRARSDEAGYFLLMAAPKATYEEKEIVGKAVTFVIDTSGSMAEQDKMGFAREALAYCVRRLDARDRFNIVRFSSDVERFRPRLVSAADEREAALAFIETLEPAGGTAIHDALLTALDASDAEGSIVVFITDGRPTVGETETEKIAAAVKAANARGARVFTFGVGDTINTLLLDRLAAEHGGVADYVAAGAQLESQLTSFYNKMSHPVLSRLRVEIPGVRTYAMLPTAVPDLFRGDQLLLIGRYRGEGDSLVRLTGVVGGEERTYDFEGTFPAKSADDGHAFIAQLWAGRQVGFLLEQIRLHGETSERIEEVKQLALQYGIVTPYTSYLAVEPSERVARTAPARPAAPLAPRDATGVRGGAEVDGLLQSRDRGGTATGVGGLGRSGVGHGGGGFAPAAEPERSEAPPPPRTSLRVRDDRDGDEGRLGGRGKAGPARKATEPAPAGQREVLTDPQAFGSASGGEAVRTSKAIRDLKERRSRGDEGAARARFVAGKSFRWDGSAWVDQDDRAGLPTLEVKYLSEAYFAVLAAAPRLKPWLALGERVTVVWKGRAIVVSAGGKETLTDAELRPLR